MPITSIPWRAHSRIHHRNVPTPHTTGIFVASDVRLLIHRHVAGIAATAAVSYPDDLVRVSGTGLNGRLHVTTTSLDRTSGPQ